MRFGSKWTHAVAGQHTNKVGHRTREERRVRHTHRGSAPRGCRRGWRQTSSRARAPPAECAPRARAPPPPARPRPRAPQSAPQTMRSAAPGSCSAGRSLASMCPSNCAHPAMQGHLQQDALPALARQGRASPSVMQSHQAAMCRYPKNTLPAPQLIRVSHSQEAAHRHSYSATAARSTTRAGSSALPPKDVLSSLQRLGAT